MAYFHKNLTQEKWNSLPKDKQILNIAAELLRAKNSLMHNYQDDVQYSLERAFELIDLTINDREKWHGGSLRELLRFREHSSNFYIEENRTVDDFIKLIKNFLLFHPNSATLKI